MGIGVGERGVAGGLGGGADGTNGGAEGLRDGTLKQLFREEIKKSFEEYIAQVGQQLAESTTYFQEALNEVLGAGKKIF